MATRADQTPEEAAMWNQLAEEEEWERRQDGNSILCGCRDLAELRNRLELANWGAYLHIIGT